MTNKNFVLEVLLESIITSLVVGVAVASLIIGYLRFTGSNIYLFRYADDVQRTEQPTAGEIEYGYYDASGTYVPACRIKPGNE